MTTDTLSDVLRLVRLRGAVFYHVSFGHEWAVEAPTAKEIADAVIPGAEHVIEYHVLTKGRGWAAILGEPPVMLESGDIVMFPHGDAHVLSSAPGLRPSRMEPEWVYATRDDPKPIPVVFQSLHEFSYGTPAPESVSNVVCGFLGCDLRPFNPLIAALPHLLHLPATGGAAWIGQMLQQAVSASQDKRPGGEAMLERISEMMFVDAVRRHVERLPEESTGWLAGLRDRQVGRALALLHDRPAHAWTIEALANDVALSRSAFYDRFVGLVGQPPMHYLTQWRMAVAATLLRQSRAPVASIALDVGYESEAAFTRAFKRQVGTPPGRWRRIQNGE
ncbi:MAG: AraC family transcriptional regulator [Propionivibrio sp.]|uniref:AraC family transcriptional regulator n=1 Tax=Propionivibrio sp. TaxID=2212460 RepID=UPI001A52DC2D|nr:AraC family transcriptional regulator [Propionivibrio sp.]MBL8413270.1 AraC family transcriptional regulator [Propionivibrio sp.]